MLDKASAIEERVAELERKLSDPATLGNQREYARLAKERSQLSEAAHCAREYIRVADEIAGHKAILDGDPSTPALVQKYGVDYVMIGPQEVPRGASRSYWDQHGTLVYDDGEYLVYRVNLPGA